MTPTLLIVGTGLIGGAVGLAVRRTGGRVVGFDRDAAAAERALAVGAVDATVPELAQGCGGADLVLVATPVGQVLAAVEALADHLPAGTVVTDVGSTKGPIVSGAEELLGADRPFVGGHPMAGTEGEGVAAARADLFEGALWILTPTASTDADAYRRVHGLVQRVGATTLALDPAEHDRLVALVSHLPYAVATTLMALAGEEGDERVFRAAAGSFRDVTRTAGSNPAMWRDILTSNREALLAELDAFSSRLDGFRSALAEGRWDEIDTAIGLARDARRRFPLKGERAPTTPILVEIPVPDRAGVLADITKALGEAGVNIEDVWMDHTPAGGVVHLLVDGLATAERAVAQLGARGFGATVVGER